MRGYLALSFRYNMNVDTFIMNGWTQIRIGWRKGRIMWIHNTIMLKPIAIQFDPIFLPVKICQKYNVDTNVGMSV